MRTMNALCARRPAMLVCCLGILVSGCLSRPALTRQNFALQNPPAEDRQTNSGPVLEMRTPGISPLFARRALVYRTGSDSYELDPYAGFLIPPERTLAIPIRSYLRNSGLFQDVVLEDSPLKPELVIEIRVSELYGDFRKSAPPGAVLSLHALVVQPNNTATPAILLNKDYSSRIALKDNTAACLVAGYDEALAQIMKQLTADLASSRTTR
ncbi:MAG: ABC-type transport auxiliary lipoprotein family protein [Verrucomicrobiota bacterium]